MKGIIKITKDIVRYGDFGEKCKYLTINLKELIPYSVCAIYSFNYDNKSYEKDSISYPVAFYKPEGMDIGDLGFTMLSNDESDSIIKNGSVYVSSDPRGELKGRLSPELLSQIESAIIAPVIIDNKLAGMIFIGGNEKLVRFMVFGVEDLLNILSNQMALAIENNNIYNSIRDSADIDALTRLYNRNVFKREIQELIATRTRFSLVIYDIDDFKRVNDTYGHLVGDEVLKIISNEIRKSIRKTDVPCRYGGEEIVIIFKDLNKEDSVIISERIRKKIEDAQLNWYGNIVSATVSGGIATYPEDGKTVEDIIGKADKVLYCECKQKGKNRVYAYDTNLSEFDGM
jgi:diguanylate cyclase (GGDEF)-like protein